MNNNRSIGAKGERIAAKELMKKGYHILAMNYYGKGGEIDIIAQLDQCIVFVEVKLRQSLRAGFPSEAVDLKKQKRMIATAEEFIYEKGFENQDFQFDVIELLYQEGKLYLRHLENAFQADNI